MADALDFHGGQQLQRPRVEDAAFAPAATEEERLFSVADGVVGFAFAYPLPDEEWLFGASFFGAVPHFSYRGDEAEYRLYGLQVDALWRPHGRPFRVGVSLAPVTWGGGRLSTKDAGSLEPFLHYRSAAQPATLAVGSSWRFGSGAEHDNRRSVIDRRERLALPAQGEVPPDPRPGWVLVTAQLDVHAPIADAVALHPCRVTECDLRSAPRVAASPSILPRLGAEVEPAERRLRIRLGSFAMRLERARRRPRNRGAQRGCPIIRHRGGTAAVRETAGAWSHWWRRSRLSSLQPGRWRGSCRSPRGSGRRISLRPNSRRR